MWVYQLLFTHSLVNGHFDCFYFLTTMNNVAMSLHLQVCIWIHISLLLGRYLDVDLMSHMVILYLTFWGTARLFSKWQYHFTFPPAGYEGSNFPIFLPTLVIICHFDYYHPRSYKMVHPCGFDLHFSDG